MLAPEENSAGADHAGYGQQRKRAQQGPHHRARATRSRAATGPARHCSASSETAD